MKITILGCGSAPGVPSISAGWGHCDPANSKNRRRRASVLVEQDNTAILIDTSPDLREQLLDAKVRHLEAVIYTHGHADHIHGLDDLREVNRAMLSPIPVYGVVETLQILETRFDYAFQGIPPGEPIFRPWLQPHVIDTQPFRVGSVTVRPFMQDHGYSQTLGFRIGDFAYSTDVLELPDVARQKLSGLSVWIVGALSAAPHPTHAHLERVLAWVEELKPKRTVITHMSNSLDYDDMVRQLPGGVTPAFDGMHIEI